MSRREYLEKCDTYEIKFGDMSFNYYLYNKSPENCLQQLFAMDDAECFIIICDKNVGSLYGQKIAKQIQSHCKCELLMFECTEKHKNLKILEDLIERVLALNANRRTCIIGLGGGICGNMAGMIAALLFRGIRFVHIPTSLMAALDSVLSLKQAINSRLGKNLIGIFHKPEMVITSMDFFKTLPRSEVISGMCEVIKNALAILPDSIEQLSGLLSPECSYTQKDYRYFIDMSIQAKTLVMKNDPFEKQDALILEYGHTIGHAIELADPGTISHGEAIGLGMLCAAEISHQMGYLSERDVNLHKELLNRAGASTRIAEHIQPETILSIMKYDNKRGYVHSENGAIHMVLLESIGKPLKNNGKVLTVVPETVVKQAIIGMYE